MKPIAAPKAINLVRSQRCENCKWAVMNTTLPPDTRECHLNPPQVVPLPGPRPGTINVRSFFSPVEVTQFCGQWAPKIEGAS